MNRRFQDYSTSTLHNHKTRYPEKRICVISNNDVPPTTNNTETVRGLLNEFSQRTTLLGVSHFTQRKSVFWLVAYLICLGTSIGQSWKTGEDFFSNKGTQNFMIASERQLEFPSVTVCSYALLPQNFSKDDIPLYNNSRDQESKCYELADDDDPESFREDNDDKILRYLWKQTEENRTALSGDMKTMIRVCKFGRTKCNISSPEDFHFFNIPYYGNCFTFNPAIFTEGKTADLNTQLVLSLKLADAIRVMEDKPRIGILMHPPGTPPVLDPAAVQDVYAGKKVEFTLKLAKKTFRKGYSTQCVDRNDSSLHEKNIYYDAIKSPYLYSVEACMKTCTQKTYSACGMADPVLPVRPQTQHKQAQIPPYDSDSCDVSLLNMEGCGCALPCDFVQYVVGSDTTDISDECANHNVNHTTKRVKLFMNFISTIVDTVSEEPEYSWAQFLGILGGNLSLWIGLCIVSMLEIFELCFKLLKLTIITQINLRNVLPSTNPNSSHSKFSTSHQSHHGQQNNETELHAAYHRFARKANFMIAAKSPVHLLHK